MSVMSRMQDVLPPPLTVAADSVLMRLLEVMAFEVEAAHEDVERVRQTHWIRTTRRIEEAQKLGALLDIPPLPGEGLDLYRERLVAMAVARLHGATGPQEIRTFVYDYLNAAEHVLDATVMLGLHGTPLDEAYAGARRPVFRPLALVENPPLRRVSPVLGARGNRVPYLLRWTETNRGLDDTTIDLDLRGLFGGATAVPVVVNLTTGELIGYRDVLRYGERLEIGGDAGTRAAAARLNGRDVTDRLFSVSGFVPGVPIDAGALDAEPRVPRLVRGPNDWLYLQLAHFDVRGLDRVFLSMAGDALREGVFDATGFDESLFPSGPLAWLSLAWTETEPAAFEVRVPRTVVIEPAREQPEPPHDVVERGLVDSVRRLHAAGVRAAVRFEPFVERQPMREQFDLPFRVFDPERGPSGIDRGATLGGRFGETRIGQSRFE
ncbi:MAG: hypothetical protein AB7H96_07085 [Vicinamibacterales bacterium]